MKHCVVITFWQLKIIYQITYFNCVVATDIGLYYLYRLVQNFRAMENYFKCSRCLFSRWIYYVGLVCHFAHFL